MTASRVQQFVIATSYPDIDTVVIYEDTWKDKILPQNRAPNAEECTISTIKNPTCICIGTSNPSYLCFVNQSLTSATNGHPFVAIVDPTSQPPALTSIGYRREFKDLTTIQSYGGPVMPKIAASYDFNADVLYVNFGPPVPIEGDGLPRGIELDYAIEGGAPCGLTVVGFKRNGWDFDLSGLASIVSDHLSVPSLKAVQAITDAVRSEA